MLVIPTFIVFFVHASPECAPCVLTLCAECSYYIVILYYDPECSQDIPAEEQLPPQTSPTSPTSPTASVSTTDATTQGSKQSKEPISAADFLAQKSSSSSVPAIKRKSELRRYVEGFDQVRVGFNLFGFEHPFEASTAQMLKGGSSSDRWA